MSEALNNAIAVLDSQPTAGDNSKALIVARCRALISGYDARWSASDYVPMSVEETVTSDLFNPANQHKSRSFVMAGKIDVKATRGHRHIVFDHKSTSQDIADPNSPYWRQLVVESQPSMYMLLEWLNGRKVDEAVWDVMRKPQTKPSKLTKAERAAAVSSRKYFGRLLSEQTLTGLQIEERENLEMYEARLEHDCTIERPEHYFQRRSIPRLDSELFEFAQEFWDNSKEILSARQNNRWPRNSGACLLYNTPCKFLGICSGHDTTDSDRWQRKQQVHNELPELNGDGRNALTNPRIRCFQTCRKKHYFEYELGIERQDEEEKEALVFGTIWHFALNAYWSTFIPQEVSNGNSYNSSTASEVDAASSATASIETV